MTTAIKERPILFSAPMVRAILDGRKTQTRRLMYVLTNNVRSACFDRRYPPPIALPPPHKVWSLSHWRHAKLGDRLWVREAWQEFWPEEITEVRFAKPGRSGSPARLPETMQVIYRADGEMPAHPEYGKARWRSSIHMPRWASRITLEITGIRVERLQDISEADAIAEGILPWGTSGKWWDCPSHTQIFGEGENIEWVRFEGARTKDPKEAYRAIWTNINGPESWNESPWVWVIEFRRIDI